nr:MAG TPA: hypothetical protein [Caudoviricetes sp.]
MRREKGGASRPFYFLSHALAPGLTSARCRVDPPRSPEKKHSSAPNLRRFFDASVQSQSLRKGQANLRGQGRKGEGHHCTLCSLLQIIAG